MQLRLEGKIALVTGASRGLGRATALAFAREGATIGLSYHRSEEQARRVLSEIETTGGRGLLLRADVRDPESVKAMVEALHNTYGRIDILVNNAGILNSIPLTEMSVEDWDDMIATHLRGVFLCTRFVLPYMLSQGKGKVINMSGSFGVQGAPNFTHLSAAKAGIIGFTRALAREVGPRGVHVNAVAPAMIQTELIADMPKEKLDELVARYPLRRAGTPEEVTATLLFLATADSDFYTGQTLCPAGGDIMV